MTCIYKQPGRAIILIGELESLGKLKNCANLAEGRVKNIFKMAASSPINRSRGGQWI